MINYKTLQKLIFYIFFCGVLGACSFGSGTSSGNGVTVDIVHAGSIRVSSGRIHIRLRGGAEYICRKRPLTRSSIREALENAAVPAEVIEDYFAGEEDALEEESEGSTDSIRHTVGDNWISFGLRIRNTTNNALIVTEISITAQGECGEEEFAYTGTEIADGYCESDYLYIVPPTGLNSAVNYVPDGSPIENLKLFFDGFTILDGRKDPDFEYPKGCREDKTRKVAIPRYRGELIVRGYFIGNTDELERIDFTEYVPFTLSTQAQ